MTNEETKNELRTDSMTNAPTAKNNGEDIETRTKTKRKSGTKTATKTATKTKSATKNDTKAKSATKSTTAAKSRKKTSSKSAKTEDQAAQQTTQQTTQDLTPQPADTPQVPADETITVAHTEASEPVGNGKTDIQTAQVEDKAIVEAEDTPEPQASMPARTSEPNEQTSLPKTQEKPSENRQKPSENRQKPAENKQKAEENRQKADEARQKAEQNRQEQNRQERVIPPCPTLLIRDIVELCAAPQKQLLLSDAQIQQLSQEESARRFRWIEGTLALVLNYDIVVSDTNIWLELLTGHTSSHSDPRYNARLQFERQLEFISRLMKHRGGRFMMMSETYEEIDRFATMIDPVSPRDADFNDETVCRNIAARLAKRLILSQQRENRLRIEGIGSESHHSSFADPAIIHRCVELFSQGRRVLLLTNDASVGIRTMGMCDDLQRTNGIPDSEWDKVYAPLRPMVITMDDLRLLDAYTRQYHFLQQAAGKQWMEDVPQTMPVRSVEPLTLWEEGFRAGDRYAEKKVMQKQAANTQKQPATQQKPASNNQKQNQNNQKQNQNNQKQTANSQKQPANSQKKQQKPKQDQPKQDQPKQDQPKTDQPKQEQPKQDQPKQE